MPVAPRIRMCEGIAWRLDYVEISYGLELMLFEAWILNILLIVSECY